MALTAVSSAAAMPAAGARARPRLVAAWLLVCAGMVAAMVVIGGVTRLTESGLSIVEWAPIGGIVPPLSQADWLALLEQYRATPQYQQVNRGMSLAEFQTIFWWEYIHRLWGRLIGLAYALPLAWLWAAGAIPRGYKAPLLGLLVLGGLQGALGWWMVASGLKDVPWVSPYRLTAHLSLALVIFSLCLWLAFRLRDARPAAPGRVWAFAPAGMTLLTAMAGGFVAGLDAGLIHNTFPTMSGAWIPSDYRTPGLSWLANAFENHAAVQLHHRLLAFATVATVLIGAGAALRRGVDRATELTALGCIVLVLAQAGLGVATLLAQVPVALGAAHQAGAVALLAATLRLAWLKTRDGAPRP